MCRKHAGAKHVEIRVERLALCQPGRADEVLFSMMDDGRGADLSAGKPGLGLIAECVSGSRPLVGACRSLPSRPRGFGIQAHIPAVDTQRGRDRMSALDHWSCSSTITRWCAVAIAACFEESGGISVVGRGGRQFPKVFQQFSSLGTGRGCDGHMPCRESAVLKACAASYTRWPDGACTGFQHV